MVVVRTVREIQTADRQRGVEEEVAWNAVRNGGGR
jgi:hypothetical protein